jgi:preprotein translocase subunit YajC
MCALDSQVCGNYKNQEQYEWLQRFSGVWEKLEDRYYFNERRRKKEKKMKVNFKVNNIVTFGDDVWVNVENYSVDISGLSGTIVYISEDKSEIYVQMEEVVEGFEEYDNTIHFGSGTDIDVLYSGYLYFAEKNKRRKK